MHSTAEIKCYDLETGIVKWTKEKEIQGMDIEVGEKFVLVDVNNSNHELLLLDANTGEVQWIFADQRISKMKVTSNYIYLVGEAFYVVDIDNGNILKEYDTPYSNYPYSENRQVGSISNYYKTDLKLMVKDRGIGNSDFVLMNVQNYLFAMEQE